MGQFFFTSSSLLAQAGEGEAIHREPWAGTAQLWIYILLLLAVMFGLMQVAKGGLNERVFRNKWTQRFEQLYLFIENMCIGTIGAHGRKYIPMIMTLWMIIFAGNIMALFMPFSPTASLSFNLGMAIVSIAYVQYEGIRSNGFFRHIGHFTGPKLTGGMVVISGMIFIIEIVSELMKNLSLSLRLYGNIHGGHVAVEKMNALGASVYVPLGEFLLPIKLLTCVVQAMIFTLLTCVYLSLVTHHDEDHGSDDHGDGHGAMAPAH
jgi:F-type H+-transporting ATPase subunit a